jgi:raw score 4.85
MKKIISLLCLLVLAACSNNNTPPAYDSTTPFYKYMTHLEGEKILIRGVVKTPDNKTYLLSDNEDYEFSGIDARYLQPLFQPEYMTKLLKSNRSDDKFSLTLAFDADRSNNLVKVNYDLKLPMKYLDTLRQSLKGLEQRWRIIYDDGNCEVGDFFHQEPSECKDNKPKTQITLYMEKGNKQIINGRIVKLNNRDEILKKSSLPIPIPAYLSNFRLKTDKEIQSKKWEDTKEAAKDGVKDTLMIITAPIWLPLYIYGFSGRIG